MVSSRKKPNLYLLLISTSSFLVVWSKLSEFLWPFLSSRHDYRLGFFYNEKRMTKTILDHRDLCLYIVSILYAISIILEILQFWIWRIRWEPTHWFKLNIKHVLYYEIERWYHCLVTRWTIKRSIDFEYHGIISIL